MDDHILVQRANGGRVWRHALFLLLVAMASPDLLGSKLSKIRQLVFTRMTTLGTEMTRKDCATSLVRHVCHDRADQGPSHEVVK